MKNLTIKQHKHNIRQLLVNNKKIQAIKYIRDFTELGLKESKDLSEFFLNDLSQLDDFEFENLGNVVIPENDYQQPELTREQLEAKIEFLLDNGNKLKAVKFVKEILNIGLKEAKEMVDLVEYRKPQPETFVFGEDQSVIAESKNEEESQMFFEKVEELKPKKRKAPKKRKQKREYQSITFGKNVEREKKRSKTRSNSGCMLTLTFVFLSGLLIIGGICVL